MRLNVTNSEGCIGSASKLFTVNGANPLATFSVDNSSSLCSNQAVRIVNNSSVDFGSVVKVQIFWGDSSAVSYTDTMPYAGKVYSHSYPNPVTADIAGYVMRVIAYSGITCENEMDQQIAVQPGPHVQFDPLAAVCDYDPAFSINTVSELAHITGSYLFSGNGISGNGLFSPREAGDGTSILLYKYTSTAGCTDSAFQTILVRNRHR